MNQKFEVLYHEKAVEFMDSIHSTAREKLIYNIEKSKYLLDKNIFKKLLGDIWEFRAESKGVQYRMLAFWMQLPKGRPQVVCVHGFIKKKSKVQSREIETAAIRMKQYLGDSK